MPAQDRQDRAAPDGVLRSRRRHAGTARSVAESAQDKTILGLATGYGLDDNVLAAYRFLANHYEDGDRIYLFGFSRGAYTVRVLAGLIHKVGLISPQQVNLAGSGLTSYKQFSTGGEQGSPIYRRLTIRS